MKPLHFAFVVFLGVFAATCFYSIHLKVRVELEEAKLELVQREKEELVKTESSLSKHIDQALALQGDIQRELDNESKTYALLLRNLRAIQEKTKGSEQLERAVSELEKEYSELIKEAERLEETRKNDKSK